MTPSVSEATRHPLHEDLYGDWLHVVLRSVYQGENATAGRAIAEEVIDTHPSCLIPEIARRGITLKRWAAAFMAYFDTTHASNGRTEALIELIELIEPEL